MNIVCPDHNPNIRVGDDNPICFHQYKGCCTLPNHFRCTEYIRRYAPVVSHSSLQLYDKCKRAFWYNYILGLQSTTPNLNMVLGSLLHARLAILHANSTVPASRIDSQKQATRDCVAKIRELAEDSEEVPTPILLMKGLLKGYEQVYGNLKGDVEVPTMTVCDNYMLRSICDLIVTDDKGVRIIDYKYSGKPDFYTKFTCEHQSGIYLSQHHNAKSITFRVIRKPELRRGKDEGDMEFTERMTNDFIKRSKWYVTDKTFYRSEFDFDLIGAEVKAISDEIKGNIDRGIEYYRCNRTACYQPFVCDYLPLCETGLSPESLPDKYIKREVEI